MVVDNYEENMVEEDILYSEDQPTNIEPFDPKDVDIATETMVIANVVERLKYEEIILDPDFQRHPLLWNDTQKSRLIESLIIRIPLPAFYFDCTDDERLIVVDGLQRLSTIYQFMVLDVGHKNKMRLKGLEYLKEYEGCIFEELPRTIQRRIKEQQIVSYVIRYGTPEKVRTSIFTRLNTGGLQLTPAEIKNSVYRGKAAALLRKLAATDNFKNATRGKINPARMLDCEFVNRFLAFYVLGIDKYEGNLESYLNDVLIKIQNDPDEMICQYESDFIRAMDLSSEIFGEIAFRRLNSNNRYGKINKSLFDCVSVNMAKLSGIEIIKLKKNKEKFLIYYESLLKDESFITIISNATASISNVKLRHDRMREIISEVVNFD